MKLAIDCTMFVYVSVFVAQYLLHLIKLFEGLWPTRNLAILFLFVCLVIRVWALFFLLDVSI